MVSRWLTCTGFLCAVSNELIIFRYTRPKLVCRCKEPEITMHISLNLSELSLNIPAFNIDECENITAFSETILFMRKLSCGTSHIVRRCKYAVSRGRVFNPFHRQHPDNWRVIGLLITRSLALLPGALITPCYRLVIAC